MRRRTMPPILLGLALLAGSGAAVAQEPGDATGAECPDSFVCVPYDGVILEISPEDGALVGFVSSLSVTETETIAGETERHQSGTAVWLAERNGTYVVVAEDVALTDAQAAVAEVGDPMVAHLAGDR